ncbi:MAG: hypothetical protein H8E46_03615 [FCB group bacterium]|nr:hypothetical protein [FCB group bacterium]
MKRKLWFIEIAVVISLMTLLSCEGPEGPAGPKGDTEVWVRAQVGPIYYWADIPQVQVLVENCPVIPTVTINGDAVSYVPGAGIGEISASASNLVFWLDYYYIDPGENVVLEINYEDDGEPKSINSSVIMPGETEFLNVSDTLFMEWQDDLALTWATGENASGYRFRAFYLFDLETATSTESYSLTIDSVLTDTSIVIPAGTVYPDTTGMIGISLWHGSAAIKALDGPIAAGEPANITGDASGYFYSYNFGDYVEIVLNTYP